MNEMSEEQILKMLVVRLDRLDSKMDAMAQAVTALARIEERVASHIVGMQRMGKQIDDIEERVAELEKGQWKMTGIASAIAAIAGFVMPSILKVLIP